MDSMVDLVNQSSQLISIFRDKRPFSSTHDKRLDTLKKVLQWFKTWEEEAKSDVSVQETKRSKMIPTWEFLNDLESLILGFFRVVQIHLSQFPDSQIVPSRFNSDVAENIFCQERGLLNGNLTHPTYATYCSTVNSIILGQSVKSRGRKSNAGILPAAPLPFYKKKKRKPLKQKNI